MPNLDNHMDELFQKAAENYPLKTEPGNFDDLMPFIAGETATTVNPATKGKRKTALLLLAFLFIGFTIGTTYLITKNYDNKIIDNKSSVKDKSISPVQNNTVTQQLINFDAAVDSKVQEVNTSSTIYQKNKLASNSKGNFFAKITSPVAEADEDSEETNNQPGNTKKAEANTKVKIINPQPDSDEIEIAKNKKDDIDQTDKKKELTVTETKTADKTDKKNKSKYKPRIYYGIAAGVELNEVKGQSMTKAGLNVGAMLGLQINQKTAIETGVQVSQKKYYSEGKHFKPKAGSMPANMYVNSLQSSSTIIEIPVSVKYNFSKKKNTLYAKAGVSSYIMTKESNKYQAVVSGQQQEINSTYKANKAYLASEIRISAGYQHTAGKKLNIRVEPYIQIPLKGIGIGTMPVTSTGLQLVLTRN
jgi:Outer membrane protein beta-barrel domain